IILGFPPLSPTSPAGHRCFKAIMFTSGLLLGSSTIFLLCYKERVLETRLSLEVSAGIALAIGSLCGLVTALLRSVGLFSTGLLLGLLLATAVLAAAAPLVPPLSPWVLVGVLLGPALLCALLALRWPKALTTLATAVLGAAVVVACVDYFVEVFALVLHVSERLRMAAVGQLCWYSWVVLGVWPALSLLGVLLQQRACGTCSWRMQPPRTLLGPPVMAVAPPCPSPPQCLEATSERPLCPHPLCLGLLSPHHASPERFGSTLPPVQEKTS
uniref:Transmembrane protein 198 n=1 Tax=Meleagris gallopavo TaxID=9103 RepID=A0A803YHH8_MELGA